VLDARFVEHALNAARHCTVVFNQKNAHAYVSEFGLTAVRNKPGTHPCVFLT
jgi:hypothetical protein